MRCRSAVTPMVVAECLPGLDAGRAGPGRAVPLEGPTRLIDGGAEGGGRAGDAGEGGGIPEGVGLVHGAPFHCEMPPEVDMQNDEETQEMADTDPQSPLVPAHEPPL